MGRIKTVAILLIALAAASCASIKSLTAGRTALDDLEYKPIKTDIPKTKRVVLSNGMVVHLLPDHELPLFHMTSMIRAGAIWEPPEKAGLAALAGSVIRSGGTITRPPDELDETLERIAGSVEVYVGGESGSAMLDVLSKDIDIGLELFADVVRNPRFDKDRFELAKARMLDSIRRENDDPTDIGARELDAVIYAGTPYGRRPTLETVESITIEDARAFHKKYFVPQNFILGVTGDFDEEKIISQLEEAFKGWKGPTPEYAPTPSAEESEGGVYLAEKELKQSVIRMGHLSLRKTHPDYYALRVMNSILGGNGFASRLTKTIRTDYGLAYSVWSYHFGGRWERGSLKVGLETKTSSTAKALDLVFEEIEKIRSQRVSDEELKLAKDSIVNSFIFIFDSPSRIMGQRLIIDYYGMPEDYLETYRDRIMKVTADDVLRVAKEYLRPGKMKIVVVGDPAGFDRPLSEFGKVEEIELRDYSKTGVEG